MSYKLTDISLYGVTLSYEEALRVLEHAGHLGYRNECENKFESLKEDYTAVDPFEMEMLYEDLKSGFPVSYAYRDFQTLIEFFDYFCFPSYQVLPVHRQTIPTGFHDDFRQFDSDARIEANFQTYCLPVLKELDLARPAQRLVIQQTW